MQRISSNSTLFLAIFLPVFWLVFFGLFTAAVVFSNLKQFPAFNFVYFKVGVAVFFIMGAALLYFTIIRLRRVELDQLYLYASNYFKTYRYPYHNIEKITERDLGIIHLVRVYLKTPGKLGKRITFLLDENMLQDFFEKNPETAKTFNNLRIEKQG